MEKIYWSKEIPIWRHKWFVIALGYEGKGIWGVVLRTSIKTMTIIGDSTDRL
jgi:hypothetical protein